MEPRSFTELTDELISLSAAECSDNCRSILDDAVFSRQLDQDEEDAIVRLITRARLIQIDNPIYEPVYRYLMHLYVLNGSRLCALTKLERRVRALVGRQTALMMVSGVSGMGKTSLALTLRPRIEQLGYQFVIVRCPEKGTAPYSLWRDAAYAIGKATHSPYAELPAPIGHAPGAKSTDQLVHELGEWLVRSTHSRPLVIVLDDLHCADHDSLILFDRITGHDRALPVLFVAIYREEEQRSGHPLFALLPELGRNRQLEGIHLAPWTESDVERLTVSQLGECSPHLAGYLYGQAAGHPLFTMHILQNLIDRKLLPRDDDGRWLPPENAVPVPVVLRQLISQRAERLGEDGLRLLRVASIVGEVWSLQIVEPLLDLPEERLLEALDSALSCDLIVTEAPGAEEYRFSHGLIREVLYGGQIARRRKQYHARVAGLLEEIEPQDVFAIAYHSSLAESWEQSARYCLAAGHQAAEQFASFAARRWFQKALHAAEHLGSSIGFEQLSAIHDILGRSHRALHENDDAEKVYLRLRDAAREVGERIAEGRALADIARVRASNYQLEKAQEAALEALQIAELTSDASLLSSAHNSLAYLTLIVGNVEQSTHHIQESLVHARALSDSKTLSELLRNKAFMAIWAGRYREAEQFAVTSLEQARKIEDSLSIAAGHQILSYVQIERGEYQQAFDLLRDILDAASSSDGDHHQLPRLLNQMGYICLELGGAREALVWDEQAAAISAGRGTPARYEMLRYSLLNVATDYLRLGQLDASASAVARFESVQNAANYARFRYHNRYLLLISELRIAEGNFAGAIDVSREARAMARSQEVPKNVAKSHWLEGRALAGLHRYDQALTHLEKAIRIADRIMHGSLRWKIRLDIAVVLGTTGSPSADVVQEARNLIDATMTSLSAPSLREIFRNSPSIGLLDGLEQETPENKRRHPAGLTLREVEVLRLVATGATDRQIADSLCISVRTVNSHMTNIFNKTGCENRTAAATYAVEKHLFST